MSVLGGTVSAANLRLLPTSPLKPNVLQPSMASLLDTANILKPVITAHADSTEGTNNSSNISSSNISGGKSSRENGKKQTKGKKSKAEKKSEPNLTNLVPFIKHHHSVKKFQTPSVSRRNARERNRVKQVNDGFSILRNHIPQLKNKTSKVDTLRAAVDYIKALRTLMGEDNEDLKYDGAVLITDAQEEKMSEGGNLNESSQSCSSPVRSSSSQSGEMNPMVYQLPPINIDELGIDPSSISPSGSSPKSEVDSSSMLGVPTTSPFEGSSSDSSAVVQNNYWWDQHPDQQQQQQQHQHQITLSEQLQQQLPSTTSD